MGDMLSWLSRTPGWLQLSWMVWGIAAVVLLALTMKFHTEHSFDDRLQNLGRAQDEMRAELLQAIRGIRPYQVGQLSLPQMRPDALIGWQSAMIDTTEANAIDTVDAAKVSKLFSVVDSPEALVNQSLSGNVSIDRVILINPFPNRPKESGEARYEVKVTVTNRTGSELVVSIPRGQVFENTRPRSGFQNLVVAKGVVVPLTPFESRTLELPGLCLNRGLKAPIGQEGYITSLQVRFEFEDQTSLWARTRGIVVDQE